MINDITVNPEQLPKSRSTKITLPINSIREKKFEDVFATIGSEIGLGARRNISVQSLELKEERPSNADETSHYSLFGTTCPCLSFLASPLWYLVWYCFVIFFQSMVVNGFINSSIASLEKRYKLSSRESSLIASMYDIGCMLVVLPVSFYGNRGHKPLWIGMGALVMGLGCFIYASPHFLSGSYKYSQITDKNIVLCTNITNTTNECGKTHFFSKLQNFKYMFYCAQLCLGIGGSPLFTLGVAYIEEITNRKTSALYIGISTAVTSIGPAVGYITLGLFLKIYVDLTVPDKYMTPNETEVWVGAWWIGFLIAGFSLLILAMPLIMFPILVQDTVVNMDNVSRQISSLSEDYFDMVKIIKNISLNVTYIFVSIATTLIMLSLSGISTYGPKYFESVFGLTSSSATITVGAVTVPTLASGALVGGLLLSKYDWDLQGTLMFMAITTLVTTPLTMVFLMRCEETKMAGVNSFYSGSQKLNSNNLTSRCNSECHCSQRQDHFRPSCGVDNITYFSPCFAGCKETEIKDNVTMYRNCSCIDVWDQGYQLTSKTCSTIICHRFYVALIILGILLFFTYLRGAPTVTASMRCVHISEMTVALGCQSILSRILGSIPGPILFGTVIDRACILWGQTCGERGNCIKYDIGVFSKSFFVLMLLINGFNTVCFIIPRLIIVFRRSKNDVKL